MNVSKMIKELEKMGFKVNARRRTDGGWIITKINDMSFSGASGNQYARQVLGVELSQARIEQAHFNVQKYIKGKEKVKTLDEEMKKELRKVQRVWRKNKVQGKITATKVKAHLKDYGRKEATEYLKRQTRYGQGLAYIENVESVAQYMREFSRSLSDSDIAEGYVKMADKLESKKDTIKEIQLQKILEVLYEVRESGYDKNYAAQGLIKIVGIID